MFRCRVSHQMIAAAGWALGCASIMPLSATAQVDIESLTPVKNVAVADRPRPEYAAPGVSVGAFNISPTAGVEHAYDSNVLARDTDAIGSGVTVFSGGGSASSSFSDTSLSVSGNYTAHRFSSISDANYETWSVEAELAAMLPASNALVARHRQSKEVIGRENATAPSSAEPLTFELQETSLEWRHEAGRRVFGASIERLDLTFDTFAVANPDQPGFLPGSDRDRTELTFTGETGWTSGQDLTLLGGVRYTQRSFDRPSSDGVDRDAQQIVPYIGAIYVLADNLALEADIGAIFIETADPNQEDLTRIYARSELDWFVSQITTATLTVSQLERGADLVDSSSLTAATIGLSVDHELRRNLIFSAGGEVTSERFSGIDRTDELYRARASLQWLINRGARASAYYAFTEREADDSVINASFTSNMTGVQLRLSL